MRGQGNLEKYLSKKLGEPSALKKESEQQKAPDFEGYLLKKNPQMQTAKKQNPYSHDQRNTELISSKKSESNTEILSKSGKYIISGKKQRGNIQNSQNKKAVSFEKSSLDKSNSISSGLRKDSDILIRQGSAQKSPQLLKSMSRVPLQGQPTKDPNSSDTEQLQDESLNLQILKPEAKTCPQYFLIGPFDSILAFDLERSLEQLMTECTKQRILDFIKDRNMIFGRYNNLSNVEKIHDEEFWCLTMQKIIGLILKQQQVFSSNIRTLPYIGECQSVALTRLQVFMLVASMFLSIVPPQTFTEQTSFYDLMSIKNADEKSRHKPPTRLEKLKCVINYLKAMSDREDLYHEKVIFQRIVSYDKEYLKSDKQVTLRDVEVKCGKIEDGYRDGAMMDFANSAVGGGFLGNGCAQEEILFSIFPQLSVVKLLCEDIRQQQAIVIRGARRFNAYEGYSHSFKFKGDYQGESSTERSLIIAVDAMDFTKGLLTKASQYSRKFILRELHKMFVGVYGACRDDQWRPDRIFTGRWGCGVFGADQHLKFCIQWIICSHCELDMVFMTSDQNSRQELQLMVRNLGDKSANDLLSLLEQYGREGKYGYGLLNYFKDYA